jgi:hypothetical protein
MKLRLTRRHARPAPEREPKPPAAVPTPRPVLAETPRPVVPEYPARMYSLLLPRGFTARW